VVGVEVEAVAVAVEAVAAQSFHRQFPGLLHQPPLLARIAQVAESCAPQHHRC